MPTLWLWPSVCELSWTDPGLFGLPEFRLAWTSDHPTQSVIHKGQLKQSDLSASIAQGVGVLNFSVYVDSGPASTLHLKKISGISSTPKNIWKFSNPQKISTFCTMTLKCIEITPKYSPILWWPQKSAKSSYPKIYLSSWKPQKYWNSKFEPKKMTRAYVSMKISEYPPPPPWGLSLAFNWI